MTDVASRRRRCLLVVGLVATLSIAAPHPLWSGRVLAAQAASTDAYPNVYGPLRQILPAPALDGPAAAPPILSTLFEVMRGDLIGISIHSRAMDDTLGALLLRGRFAGNVRGSIVEAYASIADVLFLALRPDVYRIEAIVPPRPAVTSQGQSVHNAASWISSGRSGRGVKVGIIDVGFSGIQRLLSSELPAAIQARCYTALGLFTSILSTCDGGSVHGTAVAESLYDIAPDVQLYVSQPISKLDFANAVDWMLSQGVTVINYSVTWAWDGPGDGTSPFADSPLRTVDAAVAAGATFVAAAGNGGQATWAGAWRDADADYVHEFGTTEASELNGIALGGGQRVSVQLRWQDSWAAAGSDLDLQLVDLGGTVWASSTIRQTGRSGDTPSEYLSTLAPITGTFYVKVVRKSGPAPAWVQAQVMTNTPFQYATAGSIGNPAESRNPGMLTVGAASWQTPTLIEPYSAQGPTADGRVKPDIVGVDQASTVSYGAFGGTSQASPHVAGLAALVKSAFPGYTPQQVASYLTSTATPRGSGRPNNTWGWGLARLPAACAVTVTPPNAAVPQTGGSVLLTLSTTSSCAWTASSQASWLTFSTATSGTGSGSVRVNASANTTATRSGTLLVGSASVTITQVGVTPPATYPRNLTASVSGTLISLAWLAPDADGTTGYRLEAGTQSGASNLANLQLGSTPYFTFDATPGLYFARVRALFGATIGPPSNEVSIRVGPPPAPPLTPSGRPSAPLNLGASVLGGNVTLTWSPPADPAALLGYQLEAGSAPNAANLVVTQLSATSLFVPGVGPGTYYVRVRAGNGSGLGPPSNEATVIVSGPQPPGPPSDLSGVVVGRDVVTLRWRAPGHGGAVSGYTILAGSQPGRADIAVIPVGAAPEITVGGVPPGIYYVRMIARNNLGVSTSSNEVVLVVH